MQIQVVSHNLLAENVSRQLKTSTQQKAEAEERLSSGYRVNGAADDAAGLSISEKMRAQIFGLNRGRQNTQDAISWVQVGDGAMAETMEIVQRIRELAVQAANGTNGQDERSSIDDEVRQLRDEVDRIAVSTEFNTQKIFNSSEISMDIRGKCAAVTMYNSSYNDQTGEVTYGGIVFGDRRYSWDEIGQASGKTMVKTVDGKQVFVGGEYRFQEPGKNRIFLFSCDDGVEPPDIRREMQMEAGPDGVSIDGDDTSWTEFRDEYGNPPELIGGGGYFSKGVWKMNYEGATISVFVPYTLTFEEMAEAINAEVPDTLWKVEYADEDEEKSPAVNRPVTSEVWLSNLTVNSMTNGSRSFTVKADETGVWLDGIDDSKMTWGDLGINDWGSGVDLRKDRPFEYEDKDGTNDTYVKFTFTLDKSTSMDSVIDGLNGMVLNVAAKENGKYVASGTVTKSADMKSASLTITGGNSVSFSEEKALGRDFNAKDFTLSSDNNRCEVSYDENTGALTLAYKNAGTAVITYSGSVDVAAQAKNLYKDLVTKTINDAINKQKVSAEAGASYTPAKDLDYTKYFTVRLTSTDGTGRTIGLTYGPKYNCAGIEKWVKSTMDEDANGGYVLNTEGDVTSGYRQYVQGQDDYHPPTENPDYDSSAQEGPDNPKFLDNAVPARTRYSLNVSFSDDGGTSWGKTKEEAINKFMEGVVAQVQSMVKSTKVTLKTTEFTNMSESLASQPDSKVKQPLFDTEFIDYGNKRGIHIQTGAMPEDSVTLPQFRMDAQALNLHRVSTGTIEQAQQAITLTDIAIRMISERRSMYGAWQNRLEHIYANSQNRQENTQAAESRIRDADMAEEMVNYAVHSILEKAGQSMLAVANQTAEGVLSLLK